MAQQAVGSAIGGIVAKCRTPHQPPTRRSPIRASTAPTARPGPRPRGDAPPRRRPPGAPAPARPPARRRGRRPALRLPGRPVAAPAGHAPQSTSRIVYGTPAARPRGDPAAQRPPPRRSAARSATRAPGSATAPPTRHVIRSSRCGSTRRSSTRRSSAADAWLGGLSRARRARFYAETPPDRPGVRHPGRRSCRPTSTGSRRTSPGCSPRTARSRSRRPPGRSPAHVLRPPLGPVVPALGWVPPPLYAWTLWPAVGLLPARVREGYGLAWGPCERTVVPGSSPAGASGVRGSRPSLRWMPQARAADRRWPGQARRRASVEPREPRLEAGHEVERRVPRRASSSSDRVDASPYRFASTYARIPRQNAAEPIRRRRSSMKLPPWM